MSATIHQQYEETLQTISFLQDRLYNTRDSEEESQQEQLVRQANTLIQKAYDLYESGHNIQY